MAERLRREAHALCLQCGFWISGSPQHVREWEATHVDRECILQNSLMRSIVLAERLLPALIGDSASVEEALAEIRQVSERIGFAVDPDVYPDIFNPFLFGPRKYDHGLAVLLRLLEATWQACDGGNGRPFWSSESIREALVRLASRPETEAETAWRRAYEQDKPNRLGLVIPRLPAEYARLFLDRLDANL